MVELEKTEEARRPIDLTRSDSGVSGPALARAHMEPGALLAEGVHYPAEDVTVVAVLRGRIFLAAGIYLKLGCQFETYDPKRQPFVRPRTRYTVLVDSVINTGHTLAGLLRPDMLVACGVINRSAVPLFEQQLLTVRVSDNAFVGSEVKVQSGGRGPDTTMRLFNQL